MTYKDYQGEGSGGCGGKGEGREGKVKEREGK